MHPVKYVVIVYCSSRGNVISCLSYQAEIRRRMIGDREFEVYRVLLDEGEGLAVPRSKIEEQVWKMLMGWKQ